jgi:hypothetical protein
MTLSSSSLFDYPSKLKHFDQLSSFAYGLSLNKKVKCYSSSEGVIYFDSGLPILFFFRLPMYFGDEDQI